MKKILLLMALMMCMSCTSETSHGPCIGAFDDKDPNKIYKVSGWNIAMGVVFFEILIPPIIVIVDETFCPIGDKEIKK